MRKRKRTPCGRALAVLVLTGIVVQLIHMPEVSAYFADRNEKNNVLQVGDNTSTIEEKFDPPDTVTPDTTYNKTVSVRIRPTRMLRPGFCRERSVGDPAVHCV